MYFDKNEGWKPGRESAISTCKTCGKEHSHLADKYTEDCYPCMTLDDNERRIKRVITAVANNNWEGVYEICGPTPIVLGIGYFGFNSELSEEAQDAIKKIIDNGEILRMAITDKNYALQNFLLGTSKQLIPLSGIPKKLLKTGSDSLQYEAVAQGIELKGTNAYQELLKAIETANGIKALGMTLWQNADEDESYGTKLDYWLSEVDDPDFQVDNPSLYPLLKQYEKV